jgi:hypothetical protein
VGIRPAVGLFAASVASSFPTYRGRRKSSRGRTAPPRPKTWVGCSSVSRKSASARRPCHDLVSRLRSLVLPGAKSEGRDKGKHQSIESAHRGIVGVSHLSRSLSFCIPLPPASGTHCPGWNHDTGLMTRGRPVAYDVTRSPGQALGACDSFGLEDFMKELLKGVGIILGVLILLITVANAGLTSRFISPSHT